MHNPVTKVSILSHSNRQHLFRDEAGAAELRPAVEAEGDHEGELVDEALAPAHDPVDDLAAAPARIVQNSKLALETIPVIFSFKWISWPNSPVEVFARAAGRLVASPQTADILFEIKTNCGTRELADHPWHASRLRLKELYKICTILFFTSSKLSKVLLKSLP